MKMQARAPVQPLLQAGPVSIPGHRQEVDDKVIGGLHFWEILLIVFAVILLFGVRKIPDLGGALGRSIREFRKGRTGELDERSGTDESDADKGDDKG